MEPPKEHERRDVEDHAEAIATRLSQAPPSFVDALRTFDDDYRRLLAALARREARFAFDRDGRPAAIAAVRDALPVVERDLLDAILEDHACEVAAIEEALYHVARACSRARPAVG